MSFSVACVVCWSDSEILTPVESENIRNISIQSMLNELDEYDATDKFICQACLAKLELVYSFVKTYRSAAERHRRDDEKLRCQTCGKRFLSPTSLLVHSLDHPAKEEVRVKREPSVELEEPSEQSVELEEPAELFAACSAASLNESHKDDLLEVCPEKAIEPMNRRFSCDVCDRTFITRGHLQTHQQRHANLGDKYRCKRCQRRFLVKTHFEKHSCTPKTEMGSVQLNDDDACNKAKMNC